MNKSLKRNLTVVFCIIALLAMNLSVANGASASTSFYASKKQYTMSETVAVTVTYSSSTTVGVATAIIDYDNGALKYLRSDADQANGSGGVVKATKVDTSGKSSLSMTFYFQPLKSGDSNVSLTTDECADFDGNALTVGGTSTVKISVTNPSTSVSSNANLSSLKVSAGSLSPSFSPSRTSYTVNVGGDVKVCTISATPQDSAATVSVGGSKNLSVGKNVRTVTVTAENGTTKTYTITINRGEGGSSTDDPDDSTQDPEEEAADILVTVGDKEYAVLENYDEGSIPKGFVMTIAQYGDKDIPVIKDANLKYTFALLKDQETGDETWFFYDEEADAFSLTSEISSEDAMEYAGLLAQLNEGDEEKGLDNKDKILIIALGATVAALAIAILVLQVGIINKNKKKLKKNKSVEEVEEEINLTEDNTEETDSTEEIDIGEE